MQFQQRFLLPDIGVLAGSCPSKVHFEVGEPLIDSRILMLV
jgi:hypothetical protein